LTAIEVEAPANYAGDAFHAEVVDASPAYIWLLNGQGRIVYVNQAARRFLPSSPAADTRAWRDAWPADCRFSIDRGVQEAQAGRAFTFRTRFSTGEAAGVYLNTTVSAVRDGTGRIVRLLVKAEDVTEETESAAFLNTVIDVLPLALTVKDARSGRYILANRAAEKLFGKFDGLEGLTAGDILPGPFAEWASAAEPGMGCQSAVHEDHSLNTVRYLAATKVATYDDEGMRHLIGLTEDISQKQRDADTLRLALEQAEQANQARSAFVSNISHEIRTPLNGVMAGVDLLESRSESSELAEIAAMIRASAAALQARFEQLLSVSRLNVADAAPAGIAFEVAAFAERLVAPHRAVAQGKGIAVAVEIAPSVAPRLIGDPEGLDRALSPLLDNAVKFTDCGQVRLVIEGRPDGRIRFSCIDTGVGFDPALKDALFAPFHQRDAGLTRRFGGMGLGLALAREHARTMGGSVDGLPVESGGAEFWLEAPLDAAPDETRLAPGNRPRILVADDHPTNRRIVELMLEGVADIVLAQDGVEALEATRREPFDLIFMDIQMPRMDGITAVARIRDDERMAYRAPVPIIMLTANTQPEHIAASRAAGADRHLGKPFTSAGLLSEIQAVLTLEDAGAAGPGPAPP
jgi:signal transduction histidine kinase/ActR/RegA family two-component response regulator